MKPVGIKNGLRHRHPGRDAFTLLEVVLATIITAATLAVLAQLLNSARLASARATFECEALIRCESRIDGLVVELSSGLAATETTTDDESEWVEDVVLTPTEITNLTHVRATVKHIDSRGLVNANVTLERLVLVPPIVTEESL